MLKTKILNKNFVYTSLFAFLKVNFIKLQMKKKVALSIYYYCFALSKCIYDIVLVCIIFFIFTFLTVQCTLKNKVVITFRGVKQKRN